MSQENVELVKARLLEFQATKRASDQTAPDFVWDMSPVDGWPDTTHYVGPEGFNEFWAKWTEPYDEFEQSLEDALDAGGNQVVCIVRQRGRPSGSQFWVDLRFGIIFTVIDGDVSWGQVYRTAEEALE